ncbi:TPA: hypothetical protein DEP34_02375 [Candidatus Uhrbacteria bacterium]|uniref:Rod shape-determining protein MreD n=2 Tax=Candidatus Uhriibacteriota TaxID=1752732 RepID=A0A0G1SGE0_9BACT|nr:MAG: hypothetical protein UX45_C0008G0019 [Candidatus Uhrbacteria bacterium GW2011_GWF2_46_218]KKU41123.1 MAG: hypothetical protein UX57_C0006G0033 [Candidatus Uhrbacteria bacterium GW2011_GWE2_46_68]HBK34304.1 hypothetical protein [Candidatus Uhrbacteria bacterium]HCB19209.1 hypothetical protein [Candidatus Uhrbacteria bacterium]
MKWFFGIGLWFFLVVFELAFLHSLPFPWMFLPCVFGVSVYVLQHHHVRQAIGWIAGYGLVLDFLRQGLVPCETIPLLLATAAAWFGSQYFFSHRSYYGLLANAFFSFGVLWMARVGVWGIVWFFHPESVLWKEIFFAFLVHIPLFFFLITFLFFSAKQIRRFLAMIFFIPKIS